MRTPLLGAATAAVLAAGALATTGVLGSSHREAPRIMLDPSADNTDVYAFTAPDAPGKLTVVSNWVPLAEPGGRPVLRQARSRGPLLRQDRQHRRRRRGRRLSLAVPQRVPEPELVPVRGPAGQLDQRREPQLRPDLRPLLRALPQRARYVVEAGSRTACRSRRTTSGRRRCPTTRSVAAGAVHGLPGGGKTFVGPVDDPFFVDLGSVFDGINIDKPGRPAIGLGNQGGGKDDVSGFNVHSFALQVPQPRSRATARPSPARPRPTPSSASGRRTERKAIKVKRGKATDERWKQVSRLGNPLINEVIIPIGLKDKYNATSPARRPEELRRQRAEPRAGADPQRAVQARHQGEQPHGHRAGAADRRPRPDADLAQGAVPADTLKFNLGVPPTATPNRFGVLAGDTAGLPERPPPGRRRHRHRAARDRRRAAEARGGRQAAPARRRRRRQRQAVPRPTFPYVALPDSGFDAKFGRIEPAHAPVPQPPVG